MILTSTEVKTQRKKDKIMKKWITPVVEELDINATAHHHHHHHHHNGGNNGGNNGCNNSGNNGNGANIPGVPPTMDDVVGGDNNTDGMS